MKTTQGGRLLKFEMKIVEYDFLIINRIEALESISGLYQYDIELLPEENIEGIEATDVGTYFKQYAQRCNWI